MVWNDTKREGYLFSAFINPVLVPIQHKPQLTVKFKSKRKYVEAVKTLKVK